jgi:hypothetical protein
MDTFLIATNLFLLLFWVRLWSEPDKELYFNPFLSAPTRFTDRVLGFLRPAIPLPGRLLALLLIVFFLTFRAVLANNFMPEEPWTITIGTFFRYAPRTPDVYGVILFSVLDFLFFIARFWGVYVLVQLLTPIPRRDRAAQTFFYAALPISMFRRWSQLVLLLAVHAVLAYEISQAGTPLTAPVAAAVAHPALPLATAATFNLIQLGRLALFSVADSLLMAWQLMFALLVTSFAALMLQNPLLTAVSTEGVNTLLGGTRKRLLIGFLDLTPLLYMGSVYLLYNMVVLPILFASM